VATIRKTLIWTETALLPSSVDGISLAAAVVGATVVAVAIATKGNINNRKEST